MSSPLSDALRSAVDQHIEEQEKKIKNRAEIAMERTESIVKNDINKLIKSYIEKYYSGYSPKVYARTNNLKDSGAMRAYVEEHRSNGYIGFEYGAEFSPELMDHKLLTLYPGRVRKRDGAPYTYVNDDVDELKILNNLRIGEHPNTGVNTGQIWGADMSGPIPEELRNWGKNGKIKNIFMEEFRKLL